MSSLQDPDAFFDDLETVVYGSHFESREQVRQVFEEAGIYTFTFAEYFLDEPIRFSKSKKAVLRERKLYFPFLPWAASLLLFRVKTSEEGNKGKKIKTEFLAKTREWKKDIRKSCRSGTLISLLASQVNRIQAFCMDTSSWHYDEIIYKASDFEKARDSAVKLNGPSEDLNEGLVSYDIQLHLWSQSSVSKQQPVVIVRIPIASEYCYYGQLLVVYQEQEEVLLSGDNRKVEAYKKSNGLIPICVKLRAILGDLAKDRYTPTLALLHVSKWEKKLREDITSLKDNKANVISILDNEDASSPITLGWKDSNNPIEQAFGRLWHNRHDAWVKSQKCETTVKTLGTIENSIILDEYHIASPAMVTQVLEVVRGAALMKGSGVKAKSLPSALVFGEAGSGKDQMARLIGTLTNGFWNIEPTTQNMAAVKPSLLAVPLMFGININHTNFKVPGIFRLKSTDGGEDPDPQVLILDELNSLDYDMQGSLLRLLENNEAIPMFSDGKPERVNALVVGVVNEDPERVTREEELRLLDGAREFLGQAESARLYEALHKTRRLRPDLVYRLKRGVYVRMPALRHRREDIPLLFFHPCKKTIKDIAISAGKDKDKLPIIQCDLEAYDELMRKDLIWPGNIRQLQAVASKVASETWERHKDAEPDTISISRADVIKVLKNEFREAYSQQSVPPI